MCRNLLVLARKVQELGHESKFERLRGIIEDKRFRNEKLLVFTEHRDTMTYLKSRLDGLGFTGQVASIHGGMNYLRTGRTGRVFQEATSKKAGRASWFARMRPGKASTCNSAG